MLTGRAAAASAGDRRTAGAGREAPPGAGGAAFRMASRGTPPLARLLLAVRALALLAAALPPAEVGPNGPIGRLTACRPAQPGALPLPRGLALRLRGAPPPCLHTSSPARVRGLLRAQRHARCPRAYMRSYRRCAAALRVRAPTHACTREHTRRPGGKMRNAAAERQTLKRQRTILSRSGGVSKAATKSKSGRARRGGRAGKQRRHEAGSRHDEDLSPRIVALIPVTRGASVDGARQRLLEVCRELGHSQAPPPSLDADSGSAPNAGIASPMTLRLPASCGGPSGGRVTLLAVDTTDSGAMLNALKVADCAVLLHHGAELPAPSCAIKSPPDMRLHADQRGGLAIACMRAQGLPALVVAAASGTEALPPKTRSAARKARAKLLHVEGLGDEAALRAYDLDQTQQVAALLRVISSRSAAGGPAWRRPYSYLMAASASFSERDGGSDRGTQMGEGDEEEAQEDGADGVRGSLFVHGYVRSRLLSANQLAHITGVGTFKICCIMVAQDPCPLKTSRHWSAGREGGRAGDRMEDAGWPLSTEAKGVEEGPGLGQTYGGDWGCVPVPRGAAVGCGVGGCGGRAEGVLSVCNQSLAHPLESQPDSDSESSDERHGNSDDDNNGSRDDKSDAGQPMEEEEGETVALGGGGGRWAAGRDDGRERHSAGLVAGREAGLGAGAGGGGYDGGGAASGVRTREALGFGGLAGRVVGGESVYRDGVPLGALPVLSSVGGGAGQVRSRLIRLCPCYRL